MVEELKIISKADFVLLDPGSIKINVVNYEKRAFNFTSYAVELQLTLNSRKQLYRKLTRYRELECFDGVLRDKFKNLTLPELPKTNAKNFFNKE